MRGWVNPNYYACLSNSKKENSSRKRNGNEITVSKIENLIRSFFFDKILLHAITLQNYTPPIGTRVVESE